MEREVDVVIERDADGCYVASVPALPGCHARACSMDELIERVKEAMLPCLEDRSESPEALEFVGVQRVRIAA